MGKWQSVCERLTDPVRKYRGLVRHPWDLGTMSPALAEGTRIPPPTLAEKIAARRGPALTEALRGLHNPDWEEAFTHYADLMTTRYISDSGPDADPTWRTLRGLVARAALEMDLVPIRGRAEAGEIAAWQWTPHQSDQTDGRGRGPSR